MGDILGKLPFHANGRQRKKEDSDERNDNTFIFFADRLWKAAAPLFDKEKNKQIRLELMTERERVMWRTETENQRIVVLTDDEGLYAEAKKR